MAKTKNVYANDVYIGKKVPVRVLFTPALTEARKIGGRGDAKFEVQIGMPKDHPDYAALRAAMGRIAKERWNGEKTLDDLQLKFSDGDAEYEAALNHPEEDKRRDYPWLKGMQIMKLRSKNPITVFDVRRRDGRGVPIALTDKDEIDGLIYAGANVSMKLTLMTYDEIVDRRNPEKSVPAGITAFPEQVLFVSDGERFFAGSKTDGTGFAEVQGAVTDEDPTGGAASDAEPPY